LGLGPPWPWGRSPALEVFAISRSFELKSILRSFRHFSKFWSFFEVFKIRNEYEIKVLPVFREYRKTSIFWSFFEVLDFSGLGGFGGLRPRRAGSSGPADVHKIE
jgi:hypothetical protein